MKICDILRILGFFRMFIQPKGESTVQHMNSCNTRADDLRNLPRMQHGATETCLDATIMFEMVYITCQMIHHV